MALEFKPRWICSDGTEFTEEEEAEAHERDLERREWYRTHPLVGVDGAPIPMGLVFNWIRLNRNDLLEFMRGRG